MISIILIKSILFKKINFQEENDLLCDLKGGYQFFIILIGPQNLI